ncbi:carbon-nitrogen hydrolase [Mycena galopus ATCC 62051]|nr:carbon-nitrogen hydrolase [Mycena galopus ATCC 62051]
MTWLRSGGGPARRLQAQRHFFFQKPLTTSQTTHIWAISWLNRLPRTPKYTLGLQAVAKELEIYISAGIHERPCPDEAASEEPDSDRVFNMHLKKDAQAIPGEKSPRTGEHKKIIPRSVIPEPVDLGDIGRVGLEICYDIRFPDLHIILRRKGADAGHTGKRSYAPLRPTTKVYVIAATQAGAHSPQRSSWGQALVFDPWGVEHGHLLSINDADDPTRIPPQFILADVDLARVRSVRELHDVGTLSRASTDKASVGRDPSRNEPGNSSSFNLGKVRLNSIMGTQQTNSL